MSSRSASDKVNKIIYETINKVEEDLRKLAVNAVDSGSSTRVVDSQTAKLSTMNEVIKEYQRKNKAGFENNLANRTNYMAEKLSISPSEESLTSESTNRSNRRSESNIEVNPVTVTSLPDLSGISIDVTVTIDTSTGTRTIPISIKCPNFEPKNIVFNGIERRVV